MDIFDFKKIYLLAIIIFLLPCGLFAYEMEGCISCHSDNPGAGIPQISVKDYQSSVHGSMLECSNCHTYIEEGHEAGDITGTVDCGNCHPQKNLHGASSDKDIKPECYSCHTKHKILPESVEYSSINKNQLKDTCKKCHPAEWGDQGYIKWFASIRVKSHKKQDFSRDFDETNCVGCHQGKAIHGNPEKISDDECFKCHMKDNKNAMIGDFHATGNSGTSFIGILIIALIIMVLGLARIVSLIRSGLPERCPGDRIFLLKYLLGHKKILKNPVTGTLHILVFWGCILPVIVIILAQTCLTLPQVLSSVLSLILDSIGLVFLVATVIFFIKRVKSKDTLGPRKSLFPLLILMIILLTGFLAEGYRLSVTGPGIIWASPAGYIVSSFLSASPPMMQLMIRIHFFSLLLLVALIPFTFFRHLLLAPLNILYKGKGNPGEFRNMPSKKGTPGVNHVNDFTWKQLLDTEACVSCGRCEENCPAFISGKPLSPRKIVRQIYELVHSSNKDAPIDRFIAKDEIWSCTTCMACVEACPVFVAPLDKIVDIRRHLTLGKGALPSEAASMIRDLEIYGDVNGKGSSLRADWAMNRDVKVTTPDERDVEIVIWTGCSGSFHPRYQEVSRSLVNVLQKAGVNFRILGRNELCCGDPARRLGEEELFLSLAGKNLKTFREHNVRRIITLCPHCFNTLKNEYPKIDQDDYHEFEVVHASQYVMELICKKLIKPEFPLSKSVIIHDPCYLGRGNNVYEPLRDIINSVPDTSLSELTRSREKGFCCGAGGGGMWLHENLGKRLNVIRSEEIAEKNVDVVCTACPYCQTMISDGINGLELDEPPEVLDIIEIVERALR